MDDKTIFINRDDLKILAVAGEVPALEANKARSVGTNPTRLRKQMMEQAIGRAVADLIQWEETVRHDGSIHLRAELHCLKGNSDGL